MSLPRDLVVTILLYSLSYIWLHFSLFVETKKNQSVLKNTGAWAYTNISNEINKAFKWVSPAILKTLLDTGIFVFLRYSNQFYFLILSLITFAIYKTNQSHYHVTTLVYFLIKVIVFLHVMLILIHYVLCLRFRGLYNGGSDMMMMVIGIGHLMNLIGVIYHKQFMWGFLFIAVNLVISYLKAGLVKAKNSDWLNGYALKHFVTHTNCLSTQRSSLYKYAIRTNSVIWIALSYITLFIELTFPLVLLSTFTFWIYATWALLFHFINFVVFGLNRFFWSWMLAWPALFYLLKLLHNF